MIVTCTSHTHDSTPSKSIQEHWSLWNSRQKIPQPESQDGSEQEVEPRCVECNGLAEMKCVQCDEFFCDTCFKVVGIVYKSISNCVCTIYTIL